MKSILSICAILLCTTLWSQKITTKQIDSKISEVTVFLAGAEVRQESKINLTAGKTKLIFKNQTPFLDPASVQVAIDKDINILSVTSELNFLVPESLEPRIKAIKDSIADMDVKLAELEDLIDAYTVEKGVLLENKKVSGSQNGLSVDELEKAVNFFRKRVLDVNRKLTELTLQQRKDRELRSKLNKQLSTLNYENNPKRYDIHVLVESPNATAVNMGLRYLSSQAGWEPIYDIKAKDINSKINIVYKGRVFNNTSIPWKDVKMFLSSADPYLSAAQPELSPWYLNYSSNIAYRKSAPKSANYNMSVQNRSADTWDNNQMQKVHYKEVLVSEVSVQFNIDKPYSIPADAKPYIIGISESELPATYSHFCVPKLEKKAFLLANVVGWESLNLIEGPVNIYFANKYVGKSALNPFEFNDTLAISLGRDDKVLIERVEKLDFASKSILGNQRKETYKYNIKIKNQHTKPIKIEIQDQYPISKNSEISVNVDETSDAEENEDTGILTWDVQLAPSQSQAFELSYTIKYPKNKKVVTKTKYRTLNAPSF